MKIGEYFGNEDFHFVKVKFPINPKSFRAGFSYTCNSFWQDFYILGANPALKFDPAITLNNMNCNLLR